ncbi:WD40 repeat domain-containing protein [Candidatus Poribacteria bacterium]|nr:WD40 repeat domain-containing protein [Candidatus Poribacteria bacterium]
MGKKVFGHSLNTLPPSRIFCQSFITILFLKEHRGHQGSVASLAFSPDGRTLASGGGVRFLPLTFDFTVRLWDVSTGEERYVLAGHEGKIQTLAFSPDGAVLAFGGEDGTVRLWRWKEPGSQPIAWNAGQGILHTLAFSPDGGLLASGGDSLLVRMWRMNRPDLPPDLTRTLRGHEGPVHAVAFSPDGATLASGSADHSVQVWDVDRLDIRPILLQDHTAWVWSLAFSPDGARLASAGADRTVRLWNIKPDRLAAQICTAVNGREILPDEWDQFVGGDFPYERDYQPCSQRAADQSGPSGGTKEEEQ